LRLRGERVDGGNGRVYLIVVSATDSGCAVAFGAVTVVVPKSNSQNNQERCDRSRRSRQGLR